MLVFRVTTAAAVFSTDVVVFVEVFKKEKTFCGARSKGTNTILVPAASSTSTNASEPSVLSALPSSESVDFDVKLVNEAVLKRLGLSLLEDPEVSKRTSAARTSTGRACQDSRTDADKVAVQAPVVSSLSDPIGRKRTTTVD